MTENALTVDQVVAKSTLSRSYIYMEIAAGKLIARRKGRRTFILESDYNNWIRSEPSPAGVVAA